MNDLKPCPFCGRIPTVDDCGDNRFFVRCKCGIVQDKLYGQRCDAVRRWNTRRKQPDDPDTNVGDMVSRQAAIDAINKSFEHVFAWDGTSPLGDKVLENVPSAQPELIERTAYIRGFEQGRTQGMIDSQGGKNMIKAEWTNADTLDLQPTCNRLATNCISRQAAIDALEESKKTYFDRRVIIGKMQGILVNLPSAQPEQKKGKWIVHSEVKNVYGGTYIECSQCGEKYVVQHMEDEKYCRNCGAKMEDENE